MRPEYFYKSTMLALLFGLSATLVYSQKATDRPGFVIRGSAHSIEVSREADGDVLSDVQLNLEFINAGSNTVILIKPEQDGYWVGNRACFRTYNDAVFWRDPVHTSTGWLSNYSGPEYRELAERLDQPHPPEDVTLILKPGESWKYQMTAKIFFNTYEVAHLTARMWMVLALDLWPSNVENFKDDLARKLQKRWRKDGHLWIGERSSYHWLARMSTEPIPFELNLAGLK